WDVAMGEAKAILRGHEYGVRSVAFSPDGKTLASGSHDKTIKLWDVARTKNTTTLQGHANFVTAAAFSPDSQTLASGSSDRTIKLWDVTQAKNTCTLYGHTNFVRSVAFSPDGKTLASGSGAHDGAAGLPRGGEIKLWEGATGKNTGSLWDNDAVFWSVA